MARRTKGYIQNAEIEAARMRDVDARLRAQEIECERHGIADEWPKQVAVEEYARVFADFPVGGDRSAG